MRRLHPGRIRGTDQNALEARSETPRGMAAKLVRRLVDVYGADPAAAPEAMKRFIEYALYGVGPHLQQHFTEIEQQLDLISPEPEEPEDGESPTR